MFFEKIINIIDKYYHHKRILAYLKNYKISKLIDIGAHKGEFLKNFHKENTKIKMIYAFEPQKNIFQILKKNTKNIKNIRKYNLALDNKISKKMIFVNSLSSTSTLSKINKKSFFLRLKKILTVSKKDYVDKYPVKTTNFDFFFKKKKLKNTLLKVDVEGLEYRVLLGSKKSIRKIYLILIEKQFTSIHKKNDFNLCHNFLLKNHFTLIKKFRFPFMNFEDRLYINTAKKK